MNQPYDQARYQFVTGGFNWLTTSLVLAALPGTPDFVATDVTIADLIARGASVSGYSMAIAGNTVTVDGTVQTDQVLIPELPIGPDITWFVLAKKNVATPTLSELILYIDDAYELPFTPNGLDVVVQPDWLSERGWFRA